MFVNDIRRKCLVAKIWGEMRCFYLSYIRCILTTIVRAVKGGL
jgi:hypothetical protein